MLHTPALRHLVAILMVSLLITSIGGCKSYSDMKSADQLDAAIKGYEAAMRWSDFSSALTYHKWPDGERVPLPEDFSDLRVMEYYVVYPPVTSSDESVQQMVEISYVNQNYQVLRKVSDRQIWSLDKDTKRWELITPIPLPSSAPAE